MTPAVSVGGLSVMFVTIYGFECTCILIESIRGMARQKTGRVPAKWVDSDFSGMIFCLLFYLEKSRGPSGLKTENFV